MFLDILEWAAVAITVLSVWNFSRGRAAIGATLQIIGTTMWGTYSVMSGPLWGLLAVNVLIGLTAALGLAVGKEDHD